MINRFDINEEVVCGYRVSSVRKKLWNIEMDMLDMLEETCKANGLDYFLLFGSAIGAVRHDGFIPWDDDIDIGMVREDFERFLTCNKSEFPDYIDIQYGVNEHGVDMLLRIRDARTTGIINTELYKNGNKGAFIEIYPFDYVNDNHMRRIQLKLSKKLCSVLNSKANNIPCVSKSDKVLEMIFRPFGVNKVWSLYMWVCKLQNRKKDRCEYVDTITLPVYALKGNHLFKKEDVESSVMHKFEYTRVRIPKGYHNCLSIRYGDYMELPPIEERGAHHNNVVFYDPDKPYEEYKDSDIPARYFAGDDSLDLL